MARSFETYEDYKRHLRNKWGQGEGRTYKPWFTTKDVKAPEAFRAEIFGLKTGRFITFFHPKKLSSSTYLNTVMTLLIFENSFHYFLWS